jgi:hypothetical protein
VSQKIMDGHENLSNLVTEWYAMSSSHGKLNCYQLQRTTIFSIS